MMRQNQTLALHREYSALSNGSLPPYHPMGGVDFSSQANRFASVGMVVENDAQRINAETQEPQDAVVMPDGLGRAVNHLSGRAQNAAIRGWKVRSLQGMANSTTASIALIGGLLLAYGGTDFPGARSIHKVIKDIIRQPEPTVRVLSVGVGGILVAWGWANRDITQETD
jgi:hypothetical protein